MKPEYDESLVAQLVWNLSGCRLRQPLSRLPIPSTSCAVLSRPHLVRPAVDFEASGGISVDTAGVYWRDSTTTGPCLS